MYSPQPSSSIGRWRIGVGSAGHLRGDWAERLRGAARRNELAASLATPPRFA